MSDLPAPGVRWAIGGMVIGTLLAICAVMTSPLPVGNPGDDLLCRSGLTSFCPQPVVIELPRTELQVLEPTPSPVVGYGAVAGVR